MEVSKVLNMRLPEKLYNDLKKVATKKNITLSSLVRMVLTEYVEKQK